MIRVLIYNVNIFMPKIVAVQEKCFVEWGLGDLLRGYSQIYPQILWVSRPVPDFRAC